MLIDCFYYYYYFLSTILKIITIINIKQSTIKQNSFLKFYDLTYKNHIILLFNIDNIKN